MKKKETAALPSSINNEAQIDAMNALAWELRYEDIPRAIELSKTARALASEGEFAQQPYQKGLMESLRNLGHCHERLSNYDLALSLLLEALSLAEAATDLPEQATLLYLIGGIYWSLGDYFNALDYELKALNLGQTVGDKLATGKALNIIGLVHQSIGNYAEALPFFLQSLHTYEEIDFKRGQGDALSNSSEVCFDLGNYEQALVYSLQSLQIHEDIYQSDIGIVLVAVGRIYLALEEYPRASDYLRRALDISRQTHNRYAELRALIYLGEVYGWQGEAGVALPILQQALVIAHELSIQQELYECHRVLAAVYKQLGDFEKALAAQEQFYTLKEKVLQETVQHKLKILEITYQIETARREAETHRLKNIELEAEIAERQRVEEALKDSEDRLRHTFSAISDHIYVTELNQSGQPINRFISPPEALTGYPREKIMADWDLWPSTLIHPDDRAQALTQFQRFIRGESSEVEYRLIRADGQIIWVRDSGRVERDSLSQNIVVYGVVSDISDRKQAEEALALARDHALEVSRLKSQLLAKVSHELRTPLGAILGYTELLQNGIFGPLSDHQLKATSEVIDSTHYLTHLVNELLDQAQFESSQITLYLEPFVLADMIAGVETKMVILAQDKDLTLTTDIATDLPAILVGDSKRLQQILVNLISNAIKFTGQGGVQVRLYQPDPNHWAMQVADTGIGIPPEAQVYIFEPFRQVDGSITREYRGSGLGLAIVKQLTELMAGEITLKSEVGQGSTFSVTLPLHLAQENSG